MLGHRGILAQQYVELHAEIVDSGTGGLGRDNSSPGGRQWDAEYRTQAFPQGPLRHAGSGLDLLNLAA
ncbi:hypothetical protein GCM10027167_83480 [Nocardia heshunensis]